MSFDVYSSLFLFNSNRGFQVQSGRRLVPTTLGITLVRGYQTIDVDLCLPDIRSFIEQQITLIAKGQADHAQVVRHVLHDFMEKFAYFVSQVFFFLYFSHLYFVFLTFH
jgi:DNA topoisomerase IA